MTQRAAIYARYSSDKQNALSCHDQVALCTAWAERQGLIVAASYLDEAVSGASVVNRFGIAKMLRDARAGTFDVLVCEALDRLARDQGDLANVRRELAFHGVRIMTVQDGEVGAIHIGIKGLMGELYLADLAQKTRRGLAARIDAGASGGGRSYGYDITAGKAGELVVNPAEAEVVRRIFADYAGGQTPRRIAAALNAEGVCSPRGGKWNASTINGSRRRANGIIVNRLYVGELVWNRQRFVKDPSTGKRVSRPNPETEWKVTAVPHLAIVDRAMFDQVGALKAAKGGEKPFRAMRPKHLLSGRVRCGCCGASFTVIARDRLGCAGRRERGDCSNAARIGRTEIEKRVLSAIENRLAAPDLVAAYVSEYREERRRLAGDREAAASKLRRRLSELSRSIERIVDQIIEGNPPAALVQRCHDLEAEKRRIEDELEEIASLAEPVALHPGAAEHYRRLVAQLQENMAQMTPGAPTDAFLDKVRSLIDRVDVFPPKDAKKPADLMVHGLLDELLYYSAKGTEGSAGCGGRI